MRHLWTYGVSFVITVLGVGGTLFFFMRTPTLDVNQSIQEAIKAEKAEDIQTQDTDLAKDMGENEKLQMAQKFKSEAEYEKAREILKEVIQDPKPVPYLEEVEKEYWDTNIKFIFSNQMMNGWTEEVIVQRGDSLFTLAKQNGTTIELLKESNQLETTVLRPGQKLRVLAAEVSVWVDKSLNTLTLKVNGEAVKVYKAGTGVHGSTPVGDFKIVNRIENPPWHHDGKVIPFGNPENILGTRWLGFDLKGYGIHGTWDPNSVGSESSAGCVRLSNEEVEELYKIVPVGTPVTVVE